MTIAIDTNVLVRYANPVDPAHVTVVRAVHALSAAALRPHIVPQNVYEFWVVATRPSEVNGLGLTAPECNRLLTDFAATFPLLRDSPSLPDVWRALVTDYNCKGKVAHDARLVAAMQTHGISKLLTFNHADFERYPGINLLDPVAITAATPPSTTP